MSFVGYRIFVGLVLNLLSIPFFMKGMEIVGFNGYTLVAFILITFGLIAWGLGEAICCIIHAFD